LLLAAIVLSNYLVWTATRHHHTHNLSRHRSRHRRQGAGLYLPASYVLPGGEGSGAWGEWGEVSPCSRTCGGGVASQKRICLEVSPEGQPLCTGGDTKYFSCQTQDCPETVDFRAEQCAEYDDIAFRGIKYKWLPYTNAPNPCELNCMPRGERFYFRQKTKVVDGTRCNDESFDVCVNGTCQPVGCDMMLGSNAHEDKCRECRGNGTNCRTISGLIDSSDLRKGYNDVLLIPQGSTSIYISEVRASNNYLALRSKQDNVYYLNGEYHIDFPRSLTIAGATWHYERSQQGFAAPDKLRCLGPTTEPLYLSLLLQDENVGIEYEYSLPTALAPPPNQQYNWVYGEFTPCSATCGGGTQSRQVTCRSREELEVVEDSLCDTGLKPVTDQTCNTDPCPPRWVDEPWGPCSKPCGEGGTRSRQVYCQKIIVNGLQSIVADKECFDLLGPKPELYQECNRNATCPTWFAGPWKPCDKLCDEGKQTRQVVCHQKINGKVEVFEDAMCEEEKPATEQSCMLRPCEGVDWVLSDWSGCDTCTSSVRTRVAHCATSMHKVVNSSFCSYHPAPVLEEPCDRTKLPSCQLLWYATQWSKASFDRPGKQPIFCVSCSVECGKGIQSRRVFCGLFDGASVIKVDDDRCDSKLRYNDTKPCEVPSEKCDAKWYAGPWSNCTKDCGGGQQYRRVMCLSGGVEVKTCPEDTILEAMQACNTEPCTNDPKTSPAKAATAADDYYDYEECIEEDYPEAGAEAIGPSGVTIEDVMFSDGPVTDYEGSGDYETQFTLETGSGSESTDVWTTDETGSGSTGTDFTDETTVFTSITDTTESTTDESESELTGEFIPISSKKPLYSASKKSEVTDTISSTEPSSTISDSSVSGSTEAGITEVSTDGSTDSSSTLDISESTGDESTVTSYSSTESSTVESTELTGSSKGASSSVSETELTDLTESTIAERTESTETGASSASTEATETGTTEGGSTEGASESSSLSSETELFTTEATKSDTDSSETDSSVTTELDTKATKEESVSTETSTSDSMSTDLVTTGSTESEPTEITESTVTDTTLTESSETTESESSEITESESSASTESVSSVSTESASNVSTESELSATTESGSSATTDSESSATTESGSSATTESESSATTESEPSATTESGSNATTDLETSASTEYETSSTTESGSSVSTEAESLATTETTDRETTIAGASTGSTDEATVSESSATTESTTEESTESSETTESSIASTESSTTEVSASSLSTTEVSESEEEETSEETGSTTESASTTETIEETSTTSGSTVESSESSASSSIESASTTEISSTEESSGTTETRLEGLSTTEISTERETGTEIGTTPWDWTTTVEVYTKKPGCKARRKVAKCIKSKYGCCPDKRTPAKGPFEEGCESPKTCKETKHGCCPDGVSPATGPRGQGCPLPACSETLFGCCLSDNVTAAEDNDQQGCPPAKPACAESKYGCCPDDKTESKGPRNEGCPEEEVTNEGCFGSEFGCCADNSTAATGPDGKGCPCNITAFGCCPDGVSPAQGTQMEGCVFSCNSTEFGCCADGETPAHGPEQEGCCLQFPFGCCPDNYKPAAGPHLEGCMCADAHYGCCPDNKTIARGPKNEGCGCQYTEFGCCPDRHTTATGPDFEGCSCNTYQFGCCPDGITISTGPNLEGCRCQYSQYGCCGDELTAAVGPDQLGCDCASSKYGCCPDGQTEAKGEKFLGCSDVPVNRQEACSLPTERGSCRNYTVQWYYDMEYGGCSRFWYGGCEGNGNRFQSKEECEDVCVQPSPKDACNLPKVKGACVGYNLRWYYDKEQQVCGQFVFGGCLGNANNFESRELCQAQCQPQKNVDECELPMEEGPCAGSFARWSFDQKTRRCFQFVWGGCAGNGNRFTSEAACMQRCSPPGKPQPSCVEPQETGNCTEKHAAWSFSQTENRCVPFYYTGCGGNGNRFDTEASCMASCPSAYEPEICVLPAETGECADYREKWFYDTTNKGCRQFYYGGCDGNENRFDSQQECEMRCSEIPTTTTTEPTTVQTTRPTPITRPAETTRLEETTRPVPQVQPPESGSQRSGNENRFDSQQECEMHCSEIPTTTTTEPTTVQTTRPTTITRPAETTRPEETTRPVPQVQPPESGSQRSDFCALELDPGPCEELQSRWGYDGSLGTCITFMYGGCGGNRNNFPTQEYCNYFCPDETVASRFDPETSSDDICRLPMRAGPCDQSLMRWFYDPSTDSCSQFTYGGCEGNANRFESLEECESQCKTTRPEPKTSTTTTTSTTTPATTTNAVTVEELPRECIVSPILEECSGAGTVWYADSSRQCVQHVNADTGVTCRLTGVFSSPEACERSCGAFRNIDVCRYPMDAGPCRSFEPKFYFDGDSSSCRQFLYGGCHGGPNRFSTFDECEDICQPKSDPCKVPPEPGNCLAYLPMWYYDEARDDCSQFIYSGCNGNGNRFDTREDCEGRCKKRPSTTLAPTTEVITTTTTTTTTTTAAPTTTQQILVEEQCRIPASLEPCGASAAVFYYDETRGTCLPAEFGNCRHPNSYRSEEECERRCGVFRALDVCRYRLDPGPCNETGIMKVYWDAESGRCQPFAYGGCQGGPNRFSSVDECEEVCGPSGPAPACLQPLSMGSRACGQEVPRWHYSTTYGDCLSFIYFGCEGNQNNFISYEECADVCKVPPTAETNEVLPDCEAYNAECAALRCAYGVQRTRTAGGCERCACVQVEVDCAPLLQECQRLKCYYGMLNETGDDGCQRCRCLDHPCASKKCAEGERCVPTVFRDPVLQEISYVASCNVMNKTGSCPVAEEMPVLDGSCRVECNDDADCRGEAKCCARGCSQLCLAPAAPTPSPAANIAATSAAPLTTAYQPELPQAPRADTATEPEVSAAEGGKATLRCLFHGNPPPKITWSRGAITIDGTSDRYRLLSDGALEIVSLYRNDSGVYICIADNGLGVARQEIRLLVNDPVEAPVGIAGDSDTVVMGELNRVLYIRCMAYGYPMPFIQWFRGMSGPMVPYSSSLYEARGSVLQIRRLDYDTLGDYACQAYNGVGKPASWSVVVKAYRPEGDETDNPYLVDRQERVRITPREPITEATTTPVPEITVPVYTVPVTTRILSSTATVATGYAADAAVRGGRLPRTRESRLTITSTNINDSGLYGCHARNAFSSHSSTVQITVEGLYIPPTCKDNPFFANCNLIVRSKFCTHKYYSNFCCKSCVEAGLLNPLDLDILVK
ncbi:Papilin, partial [Papilio machaon]